MGEQTKRVYIIAEAGVNHGGNVETAAEMVAVAARAGVDAVKFQSFTADGLTHPVLAADQYDFFKHVELSRAEQLKLAGLCREAGVDFLSTPFDFISAQLLADIGVPAFKIASCDLTNLPLIRFCARFGKPMYISTGMGDIAEAKAAADAARKAGSPRVVLLQCTTNYPTAPEDVNLRMLSALREAGGGEAGFSDHSVGNYACFAAVALGACVIEKHFCLDKRAKGPDIPGSCSPKQLPDLVNGIRAIERELGASAKQMVQSEREMAKVARRSIFYSRALPAGHVITELDLAFLRPACGLSPARADELVGNALKHGVNAGDAAKLEDVG